MGISKNTLRLLSKMKMKYTVYNMREAWLRKRCQYIGASDAASVIGISPWKTERQLWEEKTGRGKKRKIDEASVRRGIESEGHIRELYGIETGTTVYDGTGIMFLNDAYPWAECTLDAFKIDNDVGLVPVEIKSVQHKGDGWEQDKIPDHYFVQVLHQLAITGAKRGELLVRFARVGDIDTAYERVYTIERDAVEGQIVKLMKREEQFWNVNVTLGIPPSVKVPSI